MVREGVTKKVDVLACDLAGEYVAVLFLSATKKLKWIGPKLKGTTQIGDQAILYWRLTGLPTGNQERGEDSAHARHLEAKRVVTGEVPAI